MSKVVLSVSLLMGSFTGLAIVALPVAVLSSAAPAPRIAAARRGDPNGPYSSYATARAQKSHLVNLGFSHVSDPYWVNDAPGLEDGWFIDVEP